MKDGRYILSKLIKKQAIPLLLLTVLMVLFFVNLFNKPVAYASEQIASVKCDVFVVEGDKTEIVGSDLKVVSDLENDVINFSDVNVELNSECRVEIVYSIESISSGACELGLKLNKLKMQNFKVEYFVDATSNGELTDFNCLLASREVLEIRVIITIDNVAQDAFLDGFLDLTLMSVGENNG